MLKFDDGMIPDLDFPAMKEKAPAPRPARPHTPAAPHRRLSTVLIVLAVGVAVLWSAWAVGRTSGLRYADAVLTEVSAEASATAGLYEQALDTNAHLVKEAIDTSATIAALTSEVASLTAGYESLAIQVEDLELLNSALKVEVAKQKAAVPQKAPAPKPPTVQQTSAGVWSREQVASTLTAAAKHYGLTAGQTAWIVDTGCRVAYRESTYRPDAVNASGHAGLFQFSKSWGGDERLDPVWSCYRFVRVYAEAGEAGIVRHWKATA